MVISSRAERRHGGGSSDGDGEASRRATRGPRRRTSRASERARAEAEARRLKHLTLLSSTRRGAVRRSEGAPDAENPTRARKANFSFPLPRSLLLTVDIEKEENEENNTSTL